MRKDEALIYTIKPLKTPKLVNLSIKSSGQLEKQFVLHLTND